MEFPKQFIRATENYATFENHVPAPYMRKSFQIGKAVKSAELLITALGHYELYINGENITKGLLAPYRSAPTDLVYYDKYDVTELLENDANVIGLLLGNGMLNFMGGYIWDFDKAIWRGAPQVAFSLNIEYTDGTTESLISDTSVKTAPSPILFDDVIMGEYYDAAKEIGGWNLPDFDDSAWANALPAPTPVGEARLCEASPIKIRNKLTPVSVTEIDGNFVYDFGVNSAGLCEIKINGEKGQKITFKYFEILCDGKPHYDNIRFSFNKNPNNQFQEDIFYCSGNGTDTYMPHFTYHGFRYVEVVGITKEQATEDLLTFYEMSSSFEQIGEFKCDNEIINTLQEMVIRTDRANFYYFPTDCPQREKHGWTGDASLSLEHILYNFGAGTDYREWLRNIYKTINEKGELPGIIPTGGWGYYSGDGNPYGPAWDGIVINLPYHLYKFYGDKEILRDAVSPIIRYLTNCYEKLGEDNIIHFGLGDWCPPNADAGAEKETRPFITTIILYALTKRAAEIFDILNMPEQKDYALRLAERTLKGVRQQYINTDTCSTIYDKQTCQAMSIYYGIYTEGEKPKALENLVKLINDNGGKVNVGMFGSRVIYRVLSENGLYDLAFNMVTRPEHPSFAWAINIGHTTLPEQFIVPGYCRMTSHNHHCFCDISGWFYNCLAGIKLNPTARDIKNVDLAPCFVEKLNLVEASRRGPVGEFKVKWERIDSSILLTVAFTGDYYGTVKLPEGYAFKDGASTTELKSGTFEIIKK